MIWAPRHRPLREVLGLTGVLFVGAFAGYIAFWTTCLATVGGLQATSAADSMDWDRALAAGTTVGAASGVVCGLAVLLRLTFRK